MGDALGVKACVLISFLILVPLICVPELESVRFSVSFGGVVSRHLALESPNLR